MAPGSAFYTLARWQARPGEEEAFVQAWEDMAKAFVALPKPPSGAGTLVRSLRDPSVFYSFGPWDDLKAIEDMRADPTAQAAMQALTALCVEASPGAYEVVRRAGG